ncbi:MAG: hypothetical protein Q9160_008947, partial [Pyrenula sp. 1 TL-2023]
DAKGTKVKAFERGRVEGLGMPGMGKDGERGFALGTKLLLKKGTVVWRGCVMLEAERCVVLGGKIEALDKAWRRERKARLMRELEGSGANGEESEEADVVMLDD